MEGSSNVLDLIVRSEGPLERRDLLNLIIPPKTPSHEQQPQTTNWSEIEERLRKFHDEVEAVQRASNDEFVDILDPSVQNNFRDLGQSLASTQQDLLRLHHNISQAKEQFNNLKLMCNDGVVRTRRELLQTEQSLRRSFKQSKFKQVLEFFDRFLTHLDAAILTCRNQISPNHVYTHFDWSLYHQTIFLLRACGKAMIDVDMFERLYQFYNNFEGLTFKQPLDEINLNNFIEFQSTYSMETQLNVILSNQGEVSHKLLASFIADLKVDEALYSVEKVELELFRAVMDRLGTITSDCCRLLVDLNVEHIEAHLTSGINIDKLNGSDSCNQLSSEEALPSYAFAPQEYITQIGQHVLTLRKQTEQFDQVDNRPLKLALEHLRFVDTTTKLNVGSCKRVTEIVLKFVARHCIRSLNGRTSKSVLNELTRNGWRQLVTDAMYLDCVLSDLKLLDEEDVSVRRFKELIAKS